MDKDNKFGQSRCSSDEHFQRLEVRFCRKKKTNSNCLSITTLIIKWKEEKENTFDKLLLEVVNVINNSSFYTFLDCQRRFYNLPLDMRNELSDYKMTVYGVQTHTCRDIVYYEVVTETTEKMDNLLKQGKLDSEDGIELVKQSSNSTTLNVLTPNDTCRFTIECDFPSTYRVSSITPAYHSLIILKRLCPPQTFIFHQRSQISNQLTFPFDLDPSVDYSVHILQAHQKENIYSSFYIDSFVRLQSSKPQKFKSNMTKKEIDELFQKGVNFIKSQGVLSMSHLPYFYRNKPYVYFQDILFNKNGVMHKYMKNYGGDQASTLNGSIDGLFFSAHLDKTTLAAPNFSYYGPQRYNIPAQCLLNELTNLYFADFYCHYQNHKIMLVITRKHSPIDTFCQKRLRQLDIYDNPFLLLIPVLNIVYVSLNATVEIFFTENVNIAASLTNFPHRAFFDYVEQKGDCRSMIVGIPKNSECKICNLDCVIKHIKQQQEPEPAEII